MLEKELAQATKLAQKANSRVEQLRKKMVNESHKTHARVKRDLLSARKRHTAASARLKRAQAALRRKATPDNHKKVEALMNQVQEFAESIPQMAKSAYEAAERLLSVKTDAVIEDRKAKAANQAARMVEKAASKPKKKPAAKKKAAPKKKAAARTKAPAKRKATR